MMIKLGRYNTALIKEPEAVRKKNTTLLRPFQNKIIFIYVTEVCL